MTEPDGHDGEVAVGPDGAAPRTARASLAARFDPPAGHVVWSGRVAAELLDGARGPRVRGQRPAEAFRAYMLRSALCRSDSKSSPSAG
jgi:hypothetical protein